MGRTIYYFATALWLLSSAAAHAQDEADYTVALHIDLVKTDNLRLFDKAQFGAEVNYFIKDRFTATSGFEIWTGDEFSFLIGGRWYPTEEAFVRARGLIGANVLSIGGGWMKPINDNFRFEAMGDFYFNVDFSIRAGIIYIIRRDP